MRPHDVRSRLARSATKSNIFIDDPLADSLTAYYELLARWNRKINLTSLDNLDEAIDRLILEPIAASRYLPASAKLLMDVGSGGGSPAIPFKLAVPRLRLTMVEAKARKSAFLREAIRHLGLTARKWKPHGTRSSSLDLNFMRLTMSYPCAPFERKRVC